MSRRTTDIIRPSSRRPERQASRITPKFRVMIMRNALRMPPGTSKAAAARHIRPRRLSGIEMFAVEGMMVDEPGFHAIDWTILKFLSKSSSEDGGVTVHGCSF